MELNFELNQILLLMLTWLINFINYINYVNYVGLVFTGPYNRREEYKAFQSIFRQTLLQDLATSTIIYTDSLKLKSRTKFLRLFVCGYSMFFLHLLIYRIV